MSIHLPEDILIKPFQAPTPCRTANFGLTTPHRNAVRASG
jgi:hypothetical protein